MCCHCMNRRDFLGVSAGAIAGVGFATRAAASASDAKWPADLWDPDRPFLAVGRALRVQPILMYRVSHPRKQASWKSWGGVQSDEAADGEAQRITKELRALTDKADFPLEILPVVKVKSADEAARARKSDCDVVLVYAASGSGGLLRACMGRDGNVIVFVRRRSGPAYYWYEALSVKYLRTDKPQTEENAPDPGHVSVHDVVVDDYGEMLWRLRALHGVANFLGSRIVAVGGPMGKYAADAPDVARKKHKIEILTVSYKDLGPRITSALADKDRLAKASAWTDRYLALPKTDLKTDRQFVVNAFLLYGLFKDLMRENDARAFTIKNCMGTIMPMSKTTACLTLTLLNDEGLLAFCESDFVVIPAGILLRHISGKPVFMHNSTFPHQGIVTCAHCSAPRRMDAKRYEPVKIVTHYESEYGAAPKVEIPEGQEVTFIDPEYSTGRWLGFKGVVEGNPFYEICRSQQDVRIQGRWETLMHEVRDSHWMMAYGDHLKEIGYAARKIGIDWETIPDA